MHTQPRTGEAGSVSSPRQRAVHASLVVEPMKACTLAPDRPQVGTRMHQDPLLPEVVETLHQGIAAWFAGGQIDQVHATQQMQPGHQREHKGIALAARGRHFLVDLRHSRESEPLPSPHKMLAERVGCLVTNLRSPRPASHHRDGVNRIKPGHAMRPAQVARPHQICLLQIPGLGHPRRGIGWRATLASGPLARDMVPAQDAPDRAQTRHPATLQSEQLLNLERANTSVARPARAVALQFRTQRQNASDHVRWRGRPDPTWTSAVIVKASVPVGREAPQPFREPALAPRQPSANLRKPEPSLMPLDGLTPALEFLVAFRHRTLPRSAGRYLLSTRATAQLASSRCIDTC